MLARERQRLLVTLAVGAVLVLISLVYAPAYRGVLVGDDRVLVAQQAQWRTATLPELFSLPLWPDHPASDTRTSYYRPVVLASFKLDAILGDRPREYHFTNIAAHVVAVALLAVAARRLGAGAIASAIAALAWGVAPRLTESVAWVGGRADVLAGTLSLAALALAPDVAAERPAPDGRTAARAALAGACLLLALASKEVALAAALALAVGSVLAREGETSAERRARRLRLVLAVVLPLVAYAALRVPALVTATSRHRPLPAWTRAGAVLEAIGRYATIVVDAWRPRSSMGMLGEITTPYAVLGGLVVVGLIGASVVAARAARSSSPDAGRRGTLVVTVLALASLAPVVHVVPITISSAVVADRYLYLPLAGLALLAALAPGRLDPRRARALGAAVLLVAFATVWITARRVALYKDETAYWVEAAEQAHAHNTAARSALAGLVRDWGPPELGCRLFESVRATQEASGATGSARHRRTLENLAACWIRVGRDRDAHALLEELLRTQPETANLHFLLMQAHLRALDFDGAARELRVAVRLDPSLDNDASFLLVHLKDARLDAVKLATAEARARDPLAYARFLGHVGRSADATAFWVRVASAPDTEDVVRQEARSRLLFCAQAPVVRATLDAYPSLPPEGFVLGQLRERERRWSEIDRRLARIERLASP